LIEQGARKDPACRPFSSNLLMQSLFPVLNKPLGQRFDCKGDLGLGQAVMIGRVSERIEDIILPASGHVFAEKLHLQFRFCCLLSITRMRSAQPDSFWDT
jgi:hypothetical protein